MNCKVPEISVIVPILNEAEELPGLLASLTAQESVNIELILCDGGSTDSSLQAVSELAAESGFPVRLIQTARGRGRQMNAGAAAANSELLLFLHADSRFEDPASLCKAVNACPNRGTRGAELFAARFSLQFRRSDPAPSLSWFYYEAKARLPRLDCIRGDQGMLLTRCTFSQTGGFEESLPFLEDILLVGKLALNVKWLLLPSVISTSARRFEKEGLLERQVLNAIIVNSVATEWKEFFHALPGIYQCHDKTGHLLLSPLMQGIATLISSHDRCWQKKFWRATGHHVAGNAWQLFFWLDVHYAFRAGRDVKDVNSSCLNFYGRWLEPLFISRFAAFLAQSLVILWLRWMLFKGTSRTG